MPASFSLVTAVDEDLQCPICFEFALPTVAFATCMHKLCGGCAQHLPAVGGASNDAVACPMCRQVSVLRPDPTFTNLVAKAEANAEYRCDDCSATVKSGERRDHRCGTTDEFESLLCSLREALQVDDPEVRRRIQEEWNRGTRCAADVAVRILDSMEATAQREDGPPPAPRVGTPTRPPAPHRTPPAQLAKAAAQRGAPQKALGLLFTPAMSAKNTTSGQTATSGQNPTLLKKATPDKNTRPVPAATTQPVQPATPVQSTAKPVPTRRQPVASQPVAPAATPRPEAPPAAPAQSTAKPGPTRRQPAASQPVAPAVTPRPEAPPATPAQPPAPQRQPFAAPSATSAPPRGVPPRDARTNFAQHIASALAGVADARDFMIDEESAAYASMSMSVTRSYRVIHRHFDSLEEFLSSGGSTDPVHHFENGSTSIFIAGAYMQQSSSVTRIRTVRRTTL